MLKPIYIYIGIILFVVILLIIVLTSIEPKDCTLSWNEWTECKTNTGNICGNGSQSRVQFISKPATNGNPCNLAAEFRNCVVPCSTPGPTISSESTTPAPVQGTYGQIIPSPSRNSPATFIFQEKGYSTLDDLPINRYPFVGSHDAATGSPMTLLNALAASLPFVQTQCLDLYDQYSIGGSHFFDLRCLIDNGEIRFAHGVILLQTANIDEKLKQLVQTVVRDKDLIILYISPEGKATQDDMPQILSLWKTYLTSVGVIESTYFINNLEDLQYSVSDYKYNKKYILVLPKKPYVEDNWNGSLKCFTGFGNTPELLLCKNSSCLGTKHSTWGRLYDYISKSYSDYLQQKPKTMTIIQTFFQSATEPLELAQALACMSTAGQGMGRTAVYTEKLAFVNSKMFKFFSTAHKFTPNVLIFDNVNECTKALQKQLALNFTDSSSLRDSNCTTVGVTDTKCVLDTDCQSGNCDLVLPFGKGVGSTPDFSSCGAGETDDGTSCWSDIDCSDGGCALEILGKCVIPNPPNCSGGEIVRTAFERATCGPGLHKSGSLCYPDCGAGYTDTGLICVPDILGGKCS